MLTGAGIYFIVIFMQLKIKDSFDVEDGLKEALLDMKSPDGIAFDVSTQAIYPNLNQFDPKYKQSASFL
jgi:hypothetical protein